MTDRVVTTSAGLAALMSGATFEEALAVDDAEYARWAAEDAAEAQEAADRAEKRRLTLVEQRLRVDDRIRRRRKRKDDDGEDQA